MNWNLKCFVVLQLEDSAPGVPKGSWLQAEHRSKLRMFEKNQGVSKVKAGSSSIQQQIKGRGKIKGSFPEMSLHCDGNWRILEQLENWITPPAHSVLRILQKHRDEGFNFENLGRFFHQQVVLRQMRHSRWQMWQKWQQFMFFHHFHQQYLVSLVSLNTTWPCFAQQNFPAIWVCLKMLG